MCYLLQFPAYVTSAIDMEKMSNLAEFAQRSTQFTNHYSSGNNNNAGLVGLFYGLNASYTDSLLSNKNPFRFG